MTIGRKQKCMLTVIPKQIATTTEATTSIDKITIECLFYSKRNREVVMRNKSFMIIIVALVGISLALPASSHAWWRGHGGSGGHGWYGAGAFAGGVLLGTAIARPWYYVPAPVYVYPVPTVVYTAPPYVYVPNQAYAYPDPKAVSGTPGQWVEVPGLSVNGKWVPSHKAWVPNSP
jgi:hypothetical protein